jgi:MarR family transcriptional regulator, organic hydroperoxide resistance regulator
MRITIRIAEPTGLCNDYFYDTQRALLQPAMRHLRNTDPKPDTPEIAAVQAPMPHDPLAEGEASSLDWRTVSRHEGPDDSPGFLLWRASLEWRRSIERALAPLELTQPQFVVLAALGWLTRKDQSVRQADVGRHTGIDPNTMSQILRGLEKRKLISRRQHAHDRGKFPRLTVSGQALVGRAVGLVEGVDHRFFGILGADVAVAVALFARLYRTAAASVQPVLAIDDGSD